ncbi:MAG: nucleotidyltransferase domain-containing protein [Kofleriaceae bacterium]
MPFDAEAFLGSWCRCPVRLRPLFGQLVRLSVGGHPSSSRLWLLAMVARAVNLRSVIASGAKVHPPSWMADNLCYATMMGSIAYGVASDTSDVDVYGICMPPKDQVFPHLAGEIPGFGTPAKRFEVWQEHHVAAHRKTFDFQIYGIVRFFQLAMENNPNIVDALFTPRRCVLSSTAVGEYIREHRVDFLHKGSWQKFKGYAYGQLHKIKTKAPSGSRAELVAEFGYDVKFAYHVVRLLLEAEQILVARDIDLERDREQLKAIRRGEWTLEQLEQWAQDKERVLEGLYHASTIPYAVDEARIRRHLVHCLEMHYGDLSAAVVEPDEALRIIRTIAELTKNFR